MAKVKSWTSGEVGEPIFPEDFEVLKKAVLQVTDIKTNRNKYYALELHRTRIPGYCIMTNQRQFVLFLKARAQPGKGRYRQPCRQIGGKLGSTPRLRSRYS